MAAAECNDLSCFRAGRNRAAAPVLAAAAGAEEAAGRQAAGDAEARGSDTWRARWFARLIGLSSRAAHGGGSAAILPVA
jgi:hypothetical protein